MPFSDRAAAAEAIAKDAGALAHDYFLRRSSLKIDQKAHQDFVSEADRAVETMIRSAIEDHFPQDAIVGEEHGEHHGSSGYTWVIDPIDGTANFINGIRKMQIAYEVAKG